MPPAPAPPAFVPAGAAARSGARPWIAFALYVAVFAVAAHRWIAAAASGFSAGTSPYDSRFIAWIQAWIVHALATAPSTLFDAPINWPAPDQISAAEHFVSSVPAFAPIYWATGNPVLGVNVVALLSYPLAGIAMERLLAALGMSAGPAWLAGLIFALGPTRVPASVHVFKTLNFYLPLLALLLLRLRREPTLARALWFGVAFGFALFSSYYMALFVCLTVGLWGLFEWRRPGPGRARFLILVSIGVLVSIGLLVPFSRPFFACEAARQEIARLAGHHAALPDASPGFPPLHILAQLIWPADDRLPLAFAGVGVLGLAARRRDLRWAATVALAFVATGTVLLVGPVLWGGLPPVLRPVIGFLRTPMRLWVVTGVGVAMLVATAFEIVGERFGSRIGTIVLCLGTAAILATRTTVLVPPVIDHVAGVAEHAEAYREVGRIAAGSGGGPLLELPDRPARDTDFRADAMVGQTYHWLPLLTGFSAMPPLHAPLVGPLIGRLPDRDALDELVDLTDLRWVLLRPVGDWATPEARATFARELADASGGPSWTLGDFVLQRVERRSHHPEWIAALRRRYRPGTSLLGTPLTTLATSDAVGTVRLVGTIPPVRARGIAAISVEIANHGTRPWPGGLTPQATAPGEVYLEGRWTRAEGDDVAAGDVTLRRDLPAGERLTQQVFAPAPPSAGTWTLDLRLRQRAGAAFDDGRSSDVSVTTEVADAP